MKKIPLVNLDVDVFYEKLENGLEIYVVPKKDVNNIYATYTTKYGSNQNDFIPVGKNAMIEVPKGIAHFLEHKMFEQEDGSDVMAYFNERGADSNANTNKEKTTYLFTGPDFFEENLEHLLSYVEQPYFTDENVKKEQGIIEQEIKMYQDKPFTRLYEGIVYNAFVNHPAKYPIIGTLESIKSITKEDLYTCYHTFYHPSNMFVTITGNVNPEKVIEQIRTHEEKRNIKKAQPIKLKEYDEPDKVAKKREEIKMNITIPKVAIAYKMNRKCFKGIDERKLRPYLLTIFDLKLGPTSTFGERLKEEEIITNDIEISLSTIETHALIIIAAETKYPLKWIEKVKRELTNLDINEEELERRKKVFISNNIYMSDSIFSLNNKIMYEVSHYKKLQDNDIGIIKSLNMKELKSIIQNISLENETTFIVDSENK